MGLFEFNCMKFKDQEEFINTGRRCCTAIPNDFQLARVASELAAFRSSGAQRVNAAVVKVQFIHIVDGVEGNISEERRVQQIDVLNQAYQQHGVRFEYDPATVMVIDNAAWFRMGYGSPEERAAKQALHVDPAHTLNFYTAALGDGLLGWATFPFDLAADPAMDGVVLLHSSLPGGTSAPYNLGATAIHEVGHWFGLYHTFEPRGSCDPINDRVEDTVSHRNPDFGKPPPGVHSACDGVSHSPVKNYMNYVDDDWMDNFSAGQVARIFDQIGTYRTGLIEEQVPPPPPVESLQLQAIAAGNLPGTDAKRTFSVNLPSDATVILDGPGGVDFDLYVKRGAPPTVNEYDLRGYTDSADETLKVQVPSPGEYFIMARSYEGSGNFTLKVQLD